MNKDAATVHTCSSNRIALLLHFFTAFDPLPVLPFLVVRPTATAMPSIALSRYLMQRAPLFDSFIADRFCL
jgi:hypothetical protein